MNSQINDLIFDFKLLTKHKKEIEKYLFIPLRKTELCLEIICAKDCDLLSLDKISTKPLKKLFVPKEDILFFLNDFKEKLKIYKLCFKRLEGFEISQTLLDEFLFSLFSFALTKEASDIHIEAKEKSLIIRLRIDGILQQFFTLPKKFFSILSSVIKLKCKLDITQERLPQNGRLSLEFGARKIDFRISIMPIIDGESIVIRILDNSLDSFYLDNLNILPKELALIKKNIKRNSGLIIVTGPTGSGKTTTLYSIMKELASVSKKIISIEDPIEYKIKNVQQIAVNLELNLSFHEILRNLLRQDPDILMIGEIRDEKSLQIAIQAALTGHLVIATLHTNDASSTISRLYDLKAKPFLISCVLRVIVAQRLVLKLCPNCKKKINGFYKAGACLECNMSGFKGRVILAEVLEIDEHLERLIAREDVSIKDYIKSTDFRPFDELKDELLKKGLCSLEEIYKAINI